MSTSSFMATARHADESGHWHVIDANSRVLGRISTVAARLLQGKHKPTYTPFIDTGDHVIIINAAKVKLTGQKLDKKFYYRHSGIPGGFKAVPYRRLLAERPEFPIEKAVKGMLPHNVLGREMAKKLHVYATPDHPHVAQKPQPLNVKI